MNLSRKKHLSLQLNMLLLMVILALMLGGCAATKGARDIKYDGYLVDISMMEKGYDNEHSALYHYRNPKADWPSYSKILLDPVVIHRGKELEEKGGIPNEDLQRLSNNMYALIYEQLENDYEMVKEPGPRTLRIQMALIDVQESWATADTVTSVVPTAIALSAAQEFVTGKPSFVGEATAEGKITDARTGELLAAGIDRRVGGKTIEASVDSWDDVNKIIELWAKLFRFRLCKLRGDADCFNPQ